jgi:hypothetical protein
MMSCHRYIDIHVFRAAYCADLFQPRRLKIPSHGKAASSTRKSTNGSQNLNSFSPFAYQNAAMRQAGYFRTSALIGGQ